MDDGEGDDWGELLVHVSECVRAWVGKSSEVRHGGNTRQKTRIATGLAWKTFLLKCFLVGLFFYFVQGLAHAWVHALSCCWSSISREDLGHPPYMPYVITHREEV